MYTRSYLGSSPRRLVAAVKGRVLNTVDQQREKCTVVLVDAQHFKHQGDGNNAVIFLSRRIV